MKRVLVYDVEIEAAVPPKHEVDRQEGVRYCGGWHDHANMGVSVIGACEVSDGRSEYRVFLRDNFGEFAAAVMDADLLVGFNQIGFDNRVIHANNDLFGLPEGWADSSYDLLLETWRAAGLGPDYDPATHAGFGLDALAKANLGRGKSGTGEGAPVLWQRGEKGKVIDYCLRDVALTAELFRRVIYGARLTDPRQGHVDEALALRWPW